MYTITNKRGFKHPIFEHDLIWKNILSNQQVVIKAHTINNYRSLAKEIHKAEGHNVKDFCFSRVLKGRMSRYFLERTETTPFENWVLKNDDQIFNRSHKKEIQLSELQNNKLLMPQVQPYQQIILNALVNNQNFKSHAPSYPRWTSVSNKFGIYKRCSLQISNFLYQWYIWLTEQSGLKPDNLSILLPNHQNKKLSMPSIIKIDSLDFNQKKEQILDYLKKRSNSTPILWTELSNNLALGRYTQQARKPLKTWYQQYYTAQMVKLYGWFANKDSDSKSTNQSSDRFKFLKINLESTETSLMDLLVAVFLDAKKTVETFEDPLIADYYKSFFKHFRPQFLSSHFLNDKTNQRFKTLEQFSNVNDKSAFIDYLKNTAGLYPKLALWTINNPFPLMNSNLKVEHHIMPQFLGEKRSNIFDPKKINQPYNISFISVIIHLLMHIIRLLEYGDFEDFNALTIITKQPGWSKISADQFYDPQTALAITFSNLFKSKLLKNYPQTEKKLIEFSIKRRNTNAYKRLNPKVKRILTVNTLWYHKNDETDQPFQFIFHAQRFKESSIDPLAQKIIAVCHQRNKMAKKPYNPKDFSAARRRITDYLRGTKHTNSVYGFYIVKKNF